MRCRSAHSRVVRGNRPFAGALGASLYVGTDGPDSIRYRLGKSVGRAPWFCVSTTVINPGAAAVLKCAAVAQAKSPTADLSYSLPSGLLGSDVCFQVRTHKADIENETVYRPQTASIDNDGNDSTAVLGTVRVTKLQKLDGGGVRISWAWTPSRTGVQPTQFTITKTSGTGTVAPVAVLVTAERNYQADVTGLTNGVAYTFAIGAGTGLSTTTLLTGIAFTGDTAGPPEVTGLVAVEV